MSLKAGGTHDAVSFSGLCVEALKANILLGRALVGPPTATFLPGEKNALLRFKTRMLGGGGRWRGEGAFMSGKGDCLGGLDVWAGLFGRAIVL